MAEATVDEEPKKTSKFMLILGVVLALVGGGGGFYAVYSGLILKPALGDTKDALAAQEDGNHATQDSALEIEALPLGDSVFVPLDPITISLAPGTGSRHLRFSAQLEVLSDYESDIRALTPRIIDVLNSYLRAVETRDLHDPTVLSRLRAQMLRRVQVVAGNDAVRNLLIMEFVLN
ncbi:flagellar basal body-associated FliL family protein [Lutimaribacter sp. EGI FJ00015]|uniref:Flagellar basal body-associated FliL family protein n=1 Tax=Lutimaribacter degradans TaxID=2945989 RepID=A0ACC5ZUB8_9RHOB|nr:flagellar basal body-associated FliL family protein [Lutimaribacter sp. EGI FJ00013]MCM2561911.1 flagellar basal body-associated FliL family protein [Lutimaribacter sp. EGI FJ00013]MCO0613057.1 flagellar basal body-associated FliL family protein [Lutimaribacter sp. EGI FJ00015]MCO0635743.1 flagellar basal body-associated FliL family protein [Lutimaribacter sp. EGI FJ00014]